MINKKILSVAIAAHFKTAPFEPVYVFNIFGEAIYKIEKRFQEFLQNENQEDVQTKPLQTLPMEQIQNFVH